MAKKEAVQISVEQFDRLAKQNKISRIPLIELTGYVLEASMSKLDKKEGKIWRYAILGDRRNTTRAMVLFDKEAISPKTPLLGREGRAIGVPMMKRIYGHDQWVVMATKIERL